MRKTISNGINRRAVYKFQCAGPCNRMKFTYVYDRAKAGVCLSCSKNQVDENQQGLFSVEDIINEVTDRVGWKNGESTTVFQNTSIEASRDELVFKDSNGKTTIDMKNGVLKRENLDGSGISIEHTACKGGGF